MKVLGYWSLGLLLLCLSIFSACSKESSSSVNIEDLNELLTEIRELASSVSCEDASEWRFTALGAKACGGPSSYIAYSSKIDTIQFLNKVEDYTEKEKEFNIKTGAVSDCALVEKPFEVLCMNGKPEFSYRLE